MNSSEYANQVILRNHYPVKIVITPVKHVVLQLLTVLPVIVNKIEKSQILINVSV